MKDGLRPLRRGLLALMTTTLLLGVAAVTPAGAQEDCYPDGCSEPTNPPPSVEASCTLSQGSGEPGTTVEAEVRSAGSGAVRLLFSGSQVADDASAADVRSLSFAVPALEAGTHPVVAVGNDFSVECTFDGGAGFAVLAVGLSRGGGDDESSGALAFTGLEVWMLVAIALALLVVGWALVRRFRREPTSAH